MPFDNNVCAYNIFKCFILIGLEVRIRIKSTFIHSFIHFKQCSIGENSRSLRHNRMTPIHGKKPINKNKYAAQIRDVATFFYEFMHSL